MLHAVTTCVEKVYLYPTKQVVKATMRRPWGPICTAQRLTHKLSCHNEGGDGSPTEELCSLGGKACYLDQPAAQLLLSVSWGDSLRKEHGGDLAEP